MKRKLLRGAILAAAVILVLALPGGALYYEYNSGASCARCHEIRKNYDAWHASSHREVACGACHGDITTLDAGFHLGNLRRLVQHVRHGFADPVRLGSRDIPRLMERCRACHRQEFAQWQTGAHSATYKRLFLDPRHNRQRLLMDDCLRCHGMHFDGGIRDLVAPLDSQGPWRLLRPEMADQPAIPCLSCHQVHREGELLPPAVRTAANAAAKSSAQQELARPSVGLFDRREQRHFAVDLLPMPAMHDGVRAVKMSPDPRQALCYQCHAPLAGAAAGTGDDRTPVGVHEGLSCLACHLKHGQQTRASCATCHPRLSNCGLDVEKMDTTFLRTASGHNIHSVKCADCHPKGVPKKRVLLDRLNPTVDKAFAKFPAGLSGDPAHVSGACQESGVHRHCRAVAGLKFDPGFRTDRVEVVFIDYRTRGGFVSLRRHTFAVAVRRGKAAICDKKFWNFYSEFSYD